MSRKGIVYVVSNEYNKEGIYKIGLTTKSVEERMKQLRSTGVIGDFNVDFVIETDDCHKLEKLAHNEFSQFRIDKRREFFDVPLHTIIEFLRKSETEEIIRKQDELNIRMRVIHGIELPKVSNVEEEENLVEEVEESINPYVEVVLEYKTKQSKGLFDVSSNAITVLKGSNVSMMSMDDLLNKSESTKRGLQTILNAQLELVEKGYIDLEGNVLKNIELSVDKSCKVLTGSTSSRGWDKWKYNDITLRNYLEQSR